MNRNELDQWINRLDFDIKDTKGMHSPTQNPYLINPFVDLDAEFLKLQGVLKDIRDNGITEPKRYTVRTLKDESSSYLIIMPFDNHSAFYGTIEQAKACGDQYSFTQAEMDNLKKRDDIAIDWNKAVIKPVGGCDD